MEKIIRKIVGDDILLRVYVSEREKLQNQLLYEAIVLKARESGLAGATVSRGIMGFGADRRMHTAKILELSENLPVIIEIIDSEDNINKFLPFLDENVNDGFLTMERVRVIKYRLNRPREQELK